MDLRKAFCVSAEKYTVKPENSTLNDGNHMLVLGNYLKPSGLTKIRLGHLINFIFKAKSTHFFATSSVDR